MADTPSVYGEPAICRIVRALILLDAVEQYGRERLMNAAAPVGKPRVVVSAQPITLVLPVFSPPPDDDRLMDEGYPDDYYREAIAAAFGISITELVAGSYDASIKADPFDPQPEQPPAWEEAYRKKIAAAMTGGGDENAPN